MLYKYKERRNHKASVGGVEPAQADDHKPLCAECKHASPPADKLTNNNKPTSSSTTAATTTTSTTMATDPTVNIPQQSHFLSRESNNFKSIISIQRSLPSQPTNVILISVAVICIQYNNLLSKTALRLIKTFPGAWQRRPLLLPVNDPWD
ncbi:hypothetical protein PoB_000427500 [Plakobranchus ocellatus]|uniref:Uncharacterized protein n=1 Tax=Plakobranchus ocellatus TaxID=259542 RepID=A0AAV3Y5L3_9GAST|nr:hypothetical protein PoB_000427500 [Plakobranchus ocellatus]